MGHELDGNLPVVKFLCSAEYGFKSNARLGRYLISLKRFTRKLQKVLNGEQPTGMFSVFSSRKEETFLSQNVKIRRNKRQNIFGILLRIPGKKEESALL
jgi:hypothetical protein